MTRLSLCADAMAQSLCDEHSLVAWDREQLIGQLQQRLDTLRQRRFREFGGAAVRVVERAAQPLEAVDVVWEELRKGRRVRLEYEPRACSAVLEFMRQLARELETVLGPGVLEVAADPFASPAPDASVSSAAFRVALDHPDDPTFWPIVGPRKPGPRVAVVEEDADRELAAYVLVRASLRRTGNDPRSVKHSYVVGEDQRLHRHLQRLWVGAAMGPASDHHSFAGPVRADVAKAFIRAHELWSRHEGVETLCGGGLLDRGVDDGHYLAPALFRTAWPAPELPTDGPLLVLVDSTIERAHAGAEGAARAAGQVIVVGSSKHRYEGDVRHIRGALLIERLPPGLPQPRPA